jgi:transaldolase
MSDPLADLSAAGVSIWLDDLSRERIAGGGLQHLIDDKHVVGVTTNPSIFAAALAHGEAYDDQVRELAAKGVDVDRAVFEITTEDVRQACDIFTPTWEATGHQDGKVSIEVEPGLAHDADGTVAQAKELRAAVDRPNVFVKIPATLEGLPAITRTLAEGISVNVTLIFSLARYDLVMDAFLEGMERAQKAGHDLSKIGSVASFFVSRVDTETDRRLPEGHELRGKAAVANAKLAYEMFRQQLAGARWDNLVAAGARLQRPLWASTSTKNPAYSPTLYIDELIGPDTVNTLAQASVDVLGEGDADLRPDAITEGLDDARRVLAELPAAGVDFSDVTATLEREAVESFAKSFHDALDTLEKKSAEIK